MTASAMRTGAASFARRVGGERVLDAYWRSRLTVLAYHRVIEPSLVGDYDHGVVSATPAAFRRQMEWVKARFDVISGADVCDLVARRVPAPSRPLLVTFDDGYRDNLTNALPVLRELELSGVVFLVTDGIGTSWVPWWDRLSQLLAVTARDRAEVPFAGTVSLATDTERSTLRALLATALRGQTPAEVSRALAELADALDVPLSHPSTPLFVDWDEARALEAGGLSCEPHTARHAVLGRVPIDVARLEVEESCAAIARELGRRPRLFAYPNGRAGDWDESSIAILRGAGIEAAFTMEPGPAPLVDVRAEPFALKRVAVESRDGADRFAMKVLGARTALARVRGAPRRSKHASSTLPGAPGARGEAGDRPQRARSLRVRLVEHLAEGDPLVDEWRALLANGGSIFSTPDWLLAYRAGPGERSRTAVVEVRDAGSGSLVGVLPLVSAERRLGRALLRAPAETLGDAFDPVCAASDVVPVARAIGGALSHWGRNRPGIWLRHADAEGPFLVELARSAGLRLRRPWGTVLHPLVEIPRGGYEEYLANTSKSLRKSSRRRMRNLEAQGSVVHRQTATPQELAEDIGVFFRLHLARAGTTGKDAEFADPQAQEFLRRFAASALERGWLRLNLLEVDGTPIAVTLNWRVGDRLQCSLSGFEDAWSEYAPGILAELENIRSAAEEGIRVVDLGAGEQEYKLRLATGSRETGTTLLLPAGSPLGAAVSVARAISTRVPQGSRAKVRTAFGRLKP